MENLIPNGAKVPDIGDVLPGKKDSYRLVERLLGEGKHGISFRAEDRAGMSVFVKLMKLPENGLLHDVKGRIDRLSHYFRAEHQNAERLIDVDKIAHVLDHGDYPAKIGNDVLYLPFLVQEFFDAPNLTDYLKRRVENEGEEFRGLQVREWLTMATSMLVTLRHIHDCEVVHGDIHPGNFLVLNHEPVLIDFGQSMIRDVEQFGIANARYDNDYAPPEKWLANPGPWEQPADVFMLGMTLLFMAVGTIIPRTALQDFKNSFDLRDDVFHRFQKRNPELFNKNICLPHILIQALHKNPHERPSSRQLVTALRSFARLNGISHEVTKGDIKDKLQSLAGVMDDESATQEDVILSSLDTTVSRFRRKIIQAIRHKRVEISGDRNEIINQILLLLSHLKKGDSYWSLTHPIFWRPYNLGPKGRFYDFNKALAASGVAIRRLFLCSKEESPDALDFARELFEDHRKMNNELRSSEVANASDLRSSHGFYTGVLITNDMAALQAVVASGYMIGLAQIGGTNYSLSFASETEAKVIRRLIIERANKYKVSERIQTFCELAEKATPIRDFHAGLLR